MYAKLPLSVRKALYSLELTIRGIRQRRLDNIVRSAITRVLATVADRTPSIRKHFFYGASAIHPKHLVTWYVFQTDFDLETAQKSGLTSALDAATRAELTHGGYPQKGTPIMHVAFTSEEDVQNKAGGNYFVYFK